jgi:hypothetical protein
MLMGNGTETPHLPGMVATVPMFTDLTVLARLLRHRHAACRSALVRAALFRLRTPLQHDDGSALALPVAYGMHGASAEPTWPQVIAADADATSAAAATNTAKATTACLALFFIVRAIIVYCRSVLLSKANAVCVTVVRVWMAVWCGGDER